jgi:hypothetical protein
MMGSEKVEQTIQEKTAGVAASQIRIYPDFTDAALTN